MIRAVEFGEKNGIYKNKYDQAMQYLYRLNKINIFIGENNSGKSRLLRFLITSNTAINISGPENELIRKKYECNKSNLLKSVKQYNNFADKKINIPSNAINLNESDFFCEVSEYINSLKINVDFISNQSAKTYYNNVMEYLEEMHKNIKEFNNFEKVKDLDKVITNKDAIDGKVLLIKKGKKNYFMGLMEK